ncbi:hypothetical protein LPJ72_002967 [Coemansia sp. Benny D160-2]|nr:hypothetical protein LPJ72_002967 [Coemansia sp. Benny D160-2]
MSNEQQQQQAAPPGSVSGSVASTGAASMTVEVSSVTDHSSTNSPAASSSNEKPEERVPHIRIVPHIVDVHKGLYFDVMSRSVPDGTVLKVGRFTDKVSQQMSRIAFRSKVVSRSHAEIWTDGGSFFIKDTKSSSGTFLNHMRLSPPGVESRPHPLHDGDILQLGVDYQGGKIDVYKCVIIRLEINRNWQWNSENPFRRQVLENIQNAYHAMGSGAGAGAGASADNSECCICLYPMIAFQALFVSPCSHCFHYKCVKPILFTSTAFNCPLCRTYADLEASVTIDENEMDVDAKPVLPLLPPAVQSAALPLSASDANAGNQQQSMLPEVGVAAAAAAEAAVRAAESGAAPRPIGDGSAAAVARMVRDDSNATPVPGAAEHAVDSFGTTPVGSMPTDMSHIGTMADADASLVGGSAQQTQNQNQNQDLPLQQRGADSSSASSSGDNAMQTAPSPALLSSDNAGAGAADVCNSSSTNQQQQQQGTSPQNSAAN